MIGHCSSYNRIIIILLLQLRNAPAHQIDTLNIWGHLSCTGSLLHHHALLCEPSLLRFWRRPAVFQRCLGTPSSPIGCRPRPHLSARGCLVDQADQPLPSAPVPHFCRPCPVFPVLLGLHLAVSSLEHAEGRAARVSLPIIRYILDSRSLSLHP